MVAPVFLVQADFSGAAFGGAPTWTDITAYVLTVDDPPIVIGWGRQDEQSEAQPRTCSMTLDNSDGRFTPGLTSGPYGSAVDVGVRIRVSTTANAVTTVRFDGYVNDWDAGWDNGGPAATCKVDASDILAVMGTQQPLHSILIEELILDAPSALYPLDEGSEATSAGDVTGKQPAATVRSSKYGAGSLAFGAQTPLIGQAAGVSMSSPDSGSATTTARGTYILAPNALPNGAGWSVIVWFQAPPAAPSNAEVLASLPRTWAGVQLSAVALTIESTGFVKAAVRSTITGLSSATNAVSVCNGGWHCVELIYGTDDKTVTIVVDGVVTTSTAISAVGWTNPGTRWSLGMSVDTAGGANGPLNGALAVFGQFAAALTTTRAIAHYQAGLNALAGERTDQRVTRLLSYRPNTGSSLDVGLGTVGVQNTNGVTLQQALTDVGDAEGGILYADGQGRIVLLSRSRLYDPAVGLTLDSSLDQVTAALHFRRDTADVVDDVTVSWPGGATQRVMNAASITKYGPRAKTPSLIVNSARDAADAAGWAVAVGSTPKNKSPEVEVDLLGEPSAAQAAAVLAAGPLNVASITNLPVATAPAASVQVVLEGGQESIGVDEWLLSFYASPVRPLTLRADAAASTYTKLDNGLAIAW